MANGEGRISFPKWALAVLLLICFCPGGDMDRVCAAGARGTFIALVTNEAGIKVEYYVSRETSRVDTCKSLYYNDATGRWRLDSSGMILRERYSKFYPRLNETWLLPK